MSESSANGEVKPIQGKSRGGHSRAEHGSRSKDRDQDGGREQFATTSKLDSPASQTGPSDFCILQLEATVEDHHTGTAPAPHWCPPGLTPSQRRRIQWMRAQKMREEAVKKERDEYFNIIRPVIPTNQEWRVKDKVDTPAPTTSDDDMDLLDDDEAPLIKDRSPPPTGMGINMVFTLPVEFRGMEEEVAQMSSGPMEAVFEKPEESSQHMKPLYV
jgi:hypothetical protein